MPTLQERMANTLTLRRAAIATNPEVPTDLLPVLFGNHTGLSGGVSYCPCIDIDTFTYLISDSAVVSEALGNSPTFYVDGAVITPASWRADDSLDGRTVSTVTFAASQLGMRIGYCGQGTVGGDSLVISNPIEVAVHILTALCGILAAEIDPSARVLAKTRAAALGYQCAGILDFDRAPSLIVTEMLAGFLATYVIGGDNRILFRLDDGRRPEIRGLSGHVRSQDLATARAVWKLEDVVNQVAVDYCRQTYNPDIVAYQEHDDGDATKDAASQSAYGALGPGQTTPVMESPWCRDQASVATMQGILIGRLGTPRPVITLWSPDFSLVHVTPGNEDHVGYSWPILRDEKNRPLVNQIALVESIGIDCDGMGVELVLRDTGAYLTLDTAFDGTWAFDGVATFGGERDRRDYA